MGTPDFAVKSLEILVENGYNVVGVITAPDRPAGRGQEIRKSPVKVYAESKGLKVLQPTNLKDEGFINELKSLEPDLQVVVAFRMLPEMVWQLPGKGTFNLHASLLPQYRGAAPINWAIINGETETGVTTFFIDKEIDTGNVIFQERVPISNNDNAGILHDRLMEVGAKLVLKTVEAINTDQIKTRPQSDFKESELKPAPKIFKEDCRIDWNKDTDAIYNFIRGLSPYPCSFTALISPENKELGLKIYNATKELDDHNKKPGSIDTDGKNYFRIATSDGYISVNFLQLAGKKRMKTDELLRGFSISNQWICK